MPDRRTHSFKRTNKGIRLISAITHSGFSEAEFLTMTVPDILVEEKKLGPVATPVKELVVFPAASPFAGKNNLLTCTHQMRATSSPIALYIHSNISNRGYWH